MTDRTGWGVFEEEQARVGPLASFTLYIPNAYKRPPNLLWQDIFGRHPSPDPGPKKPSNHLDVQLW